jgi:hypothetical protein
VPFEALSLSLREEHTEYAEENILTYKRESNKRSEKIS